MFAAQSFRNTGTGSHTALNSNFNELTYSRVKYCERITIDQIIHGIIRHKRIEVVTGQAQCSLGKIICSKREKLCIPCNFTGTECSCRKLYHGSNTEVHFICAEGFSHFLFYSNNALICMTFNFLAIYDLLEFTEVHHNWNHDLG